jgi:hypothetical protein
MQLAKWGTPTKKIYIKKEKSLAPDQHQLTHPPGYRSLLKN